MRVYGSKTLRQIARFEVLADRGFKERQLRRAAGAKFYGDRSLVAISNLALLILYGAPQLKEPLTEAWKRTLNTLRLEFPNFADNGRASPFTFLSAPVVADDFRKFILPRLPGAQDNAKISRVLAKAPKWLLWHAHADINADYLDLRVPKLLSMRRFARGPWFIGILPSGPFEQRIRRVDETKKTTAKQPSDDPPAARGIKTRHELTRAARVEYARILFEQDFSTRIAEGKESVPDNIFYPYPDLFEEMALHPEMFKRSRKEPPSASTSASNKTS
jgi:hypothetical protein